MSIITEINVKNLFDHLNYQIQLNTTENITIIHGPNGCGKTWILRLINAVFSRDYATLIAAPFGEIGFKLHDGGDFTVRRYAEEGQPLFQVSPHIPRSRARLVFPITASERRNLKSPLYHFPE